MYAQKNRQPIKNDQIETFRKGPKCFASDYVANTKERKKPRIMMLQQLFFFFVSLPELKQLMIIFEMRKC